MAAQANENEATRRPRVNVWVPILTISCGACLFVHAFGYAGPRAAADLVLVILLIGVVCNALGGRRPSRKSSHGLIKARQTGTDDGGRDEVTGVYTQDEGLRRLDEESSRSRRIGVPFSIALAGVDHFRVVTEESGSLAGDLLLRYVAHALKSGLRESDMVIRYGEGGFLLIFPETDGLRVTHPLDRIRTQLSRTTIHSDGVILKASVSVGVTTVTPDSDTVQSAIGRAARALHSSRGSGGTRVVYNGQVPGILQALVHI